MTTYTVERCRPQGGYPRRYGYTLRRDPPYVQTEEDVEGVGLCKITPRVLPFEGWYKYRHDAEDRARTLNAAECNR